MSHLSPFEQLRWAYPDVEWGVTQGADRDVCVLVGTRFGHRVRREVPQSAGVAALSWQEALAEPVREILVELGVIVVTPDVLKERSPAVLYAPVHGGYPVPA